MAKSSNFPATVRATDAVVGGAVLKQLRGDSHTAAWPVEVEVYDRIVFVHGAVPSLGSVTEVAAVIARVQDVAEFIDELDVDPVEFMGSDIEERME